MLANVRRLFAHIALDGIECTNALDGFSGHHGVGCHLNVIKLAPNMGPTWSLMNPAAFIEMMKSSVAVCLQCATEVAHILARMLALAIGCVSDLIKMLWFDGDGLRLLQKRLERGRFVWPQATDVTVSLTRAQLSMQLEGIDWWQPARTWQPPMTG